MIKRKEKCRVCGNRLMVKVWDFGMSPPANALRNKEQLDEGEMFFPLQVEFCSMCCNVQLAHVVDPDLMFSHYLYSSSASSPAVDHYQRFADKMMSERNIDSVLDIGGNDGILLTPFKEAGKDVLNVEPATNIAKISSKRGISTINEFFTKELAKKLPKFDLITATNVFAHADGLDNITKGVRIALKKDGVFVVEVQYLGDQIENFYFDNVYHEHTQYWSVTALNTFLRRFGLYINTVEHIDTHGGSLRVYASLNDKVDHTLIDYITAEARFLRVDVLKELQKSVCKNREKLTSLLYVLKNEGKTIVGYGAPAKATTMTNYFGIDTSILDFIVDDSPMKQGLYTPGKHIPIVNSEELYKKNPDYVLITAWNFAQSIMNKHPKFTGKFIIPIPEPTIV